MFEPFSFSANINIYIWNLRVVLIFSREDNLKIAKINHFTVFLHRAFAIMFFFRIHVISNELI